MLLTVKNTDSEPVFTYSLHPNISFYHQCKTPGVSFDFKKPLFKCKILEIYNITFLNEILILIGNNFNQSSNEWCFDHNRYRQMS